MNTQTANEKALRRNYLTGLRMHAKNQLIADPQKVENALELIQLPGKYPATFGGQGYDPELENYVLFASTTVFYAKRATANLTSQMQAIIEQHKAKQNPLALKQINKKDDTKTKS